MSDTMVLDDFVLIDGTGRPAVPERRIVVEGGIIASVGPAVGRASGPEVIQGRGRWLIPGLWDTPTAL